jgi:hypothetical protein
MEFKSVFLFLCEKAEHFHNPPDFVNCQTCITFAQRIYDAQWVAENYGPLVSADRVSEEKNRSLEEVKECLKICFKN